MGTVRMAGVKPARKYEEMDLSSLHGARWLQNQIQHYWKARGGIVTTWLESFKLNKNDKRSYYYVKTDLLNGLPRNWERGVTKPDDVMYRDAA